MVRAWGFAAKRGKDQVRWDERALPRAVQICAHTQPPLPPNFSAAKGGIGIVFFNSPRNLQCCSRETFDPLRLFGVSAPLASFRSRQSALLPVTASSGRIVAWRLAGGAKTGLRLRACQHGIRDSMSPTGPRLAGRKKVSWSAIQVVCLSFSGRCRTGLTSPCFSCDPGVESTWPGLCVIRRFVQCGR